MRSDGPNSSSFHTKTKAANFFTMQNGTIIRVAIASSEHELNTCCNKAGKS